MSFGRRLAACRKGQKLGQAQLARATGVSRSYISKLERGRKVPSDEFIVRLRKAIPMPSQEFGELVKAAARSRRLIVLGRDLAPEHVEIIHIFVDRVRSLECGPLRAFLEAIPADNPRRNDM